MEYHVVFSGGIKAEFEPRVVARQIARAVEKDES